MGQIVISNLYYHVMVHSCTKSGIVNMAKIGFYVCFVFELVCVCTVTVYFVLKQGRKRPLDTPNRMIERREREGEREKER